MSLIDSRCHLKCLSQMDWGGELTDVLIVIELKLISCYTKQFLDREVLGKDLWEMNLFQNSTILFTFET